MRPPSMGNPGTRLKTPRVRLMNPSHPTNALICSWLTPRSINSSKPPMSRLLSGPAPAISASSRGPFGSLSMTAAPPKMKRVMDVVRTPKRRATSACESSWASTDPKKRSAVAAATSQ